MGCSTPNDFKSIMAQYWKKIYLTDILLLLIPYISLLSSVILHYSNLDNVCYLGLLLDKRLTWNTYSRLKWTDVNWRYKLLICLLDTHRKFTQTVHNIIPKPSFAYIIELWGLHCLELPTVWEIGGQVSVMKIPLIAFIWQILFCPSLSTISWISYLKCIYQLFTE